MQLPVQSQKNSFGLGKFFVEIETSKKNNVALQRVLYVHYLI